MSEPGDGDDKPKQEAAPEPAEIPPTRKHDAAEPPARASQLSLSDVPVGFPDDGPLSAHLRKVDGYLGLIEQGILFLLLAAVVLVAAFAAIHDKVSQEHLDRWWHYIVRGGTFSIAMFGAVYATQQQRHLAMDLVSRRLPPRGRIVLGIALKLFTIAIAVVLFRSGLHLRTVSGGLESLNLGLFRINDPDIVTTLPIAAALIVAHSLLHIAIDVDYLVRGKLPPERARSGH